MTQSLCRRTIPPVQPEGSRAKNLRLFGRRALTSSQRAGASCGGLNADALLQALVEGRLASHAHS